MTIQYAFNECYVALAPLVPILENIQIETYIKKLTEHGWQHIEKDAILPI
ncbi:hypothetical protein P4377_24380 [Bacillus thuringiensis]|nr:hypothetical protein [Bacillus thuringiensis]